MQSWTNTWLLLELKWPISWKRVRDKCQTISLLKTRLSRGLTQSSSSSRKFSQQSISLCVQWLIACSKTSASKWNVRSKKISIASRSLYMDTKMVYNSTPSSLFKSKKNRACKLPLCRQSRASAVVVSKTIGSVARLSKMWTEAPDSHSWEVTRLPSTSCPSMESMPKPSTAPLLDHRRQQEITNELRSTLTSPISTAVYLKDQSGRGIAPSDRTSSSL